VTDTGPEAEPCYNEPELDKAKLPLFGTSRNLESITPSSWSSGLFEEETPPPTSSNDHEDHSLYCNFETPVPTPQLNYDNYPEPLTYSNQDTYNNIPDIVQPAVNEPSPVMSTHPGLTNSPPTHGHPAPPPSSGLGIANIALRPSSIVDPDNWLFDGDASPSGEDIYENQGPSTPPPAALPQTTAERLIAQGYSAEDVGRATNIVGDNYDMALMILKSFR